MIRLNPIAWPAKLSRRRALLLAILLLLGAVGTGPWLWAWHQLRQGRTELEHGYPERARPHLTACLRIWPHDVTAHLLAARAARQLEDYDEAEEHLGQAQRQQRQPSEEVLLEWALHRATLGDLEGTEWYLLPLAREDSEQALLACEALAQGYQRHYRIPQARFMLDLWLKQRPNDVRALLLRGRLGMQTNGWHQAMTDYRRVLELEPERDEAQRGLASCLAESMRWDEAAPYWEELHRRHPGDLEVRVSLARCWSHLEREQQAQQLLQIVLETHPDHPLALRSLGEIFLEKRQLAEAETWLRRAVRAKPKDYRVRWFLYRAFQLQDKSDDAERQLDQMNELEKRWQRLSRITQHELASRPNDVDLHVELGVLLLDLGYEEAGRNWLLAALRRDPQYRPAQDALMRLSKAAAEARVSLIPTNRVSPSR
jgi:tetratricopeptide (TPR) repeat protein